LLSVVTGTASDQVRAQESLKLLNWGYLNFDTVKLYSKRRNCDTGSLERLAA
jgi:D-alanyl-D-alanine carboxypeptidase (penicillin-binding protein 5/6)